MVQSIKKVTRRSSQPSSASSALSQEDLYLRYLTLKGASERYSEFLPDDEFLEVEHALPEDDPSYVLRRRLEHELHTIITAGFSTYFLIVADLMAFCHRASIPVGPGRGSVCGSAVAYALRITDVEPIRFGIPFERFLHLERVAWPDIDSDICQVRRGEAVEYLRVKYGRDCVANIIAFGTLMARGITQEAYRVQLNDKPEGVRLAAFIPEGSGADQVRLDEWLESKDPNATTYMAQVRPEVLDIIKRLEGLRRAESVHSAGIVISNRPLIQDVPLTKKNQQAEISTQFDFRDAEEVGLLKLDILGLRTVTVVFEAERMIKVYDPGFSMRDVTLEDEATFELLQKGDTVGVFQLESRGITDALKGIAPDKFDDIVATIALYRPGPMEQLRSYIDRKHGKEDVTVAHPDMMPVLERTYGLIVYQEQVMGLAQVLAGFTPGEADIFRKAIGKKLPELIKKEIEKFKAKAVARGYDAKIIETIAIQIAYFGRYGFNLGHATGYAFLTYWTAYLKANHPLEFYAANLTSHLDDMTRLAVYLSDAAKHDVSMRPPDINRSDRGFVIHDRAILFGLEAVKGVGAVLMEDIIDERDGKSKKSRTRARVTRTKPDGTEYQTSIQQFVRVTNEPRPFDDLFDFCRRLTHVPINVKVALVQAGAFDGGDLQKRAQLLDAAERINTAAKRDRGVRPILTEVPPANRVLLLQQEREVMGFYVSDHPLQVYRKELVRYGAAIDGAFDDLGRHPLVAGIVTNIKSHASKRGEMAWVKLETGVLGLPEVTFFNEAWTLYQKDIKLNDLLVIVGEKKHDERFGLGFIAEKVHKIDLARPKIQNVLVTLADPDVSTFAEITRCVYDLGPQLLLAFEDQGRAVLLRTDKRVMASGALMEQLESHGLVLYNVSSAQPLTFGGRTLKRSHSSHQGSGDERRAVWDLPLVRVALKLLGGKVLAEFE